MNYIALIYASEQVYGAMSQDELKADWQSYLDFSAEAEKRGALRGGDALQPVSTATTIRIRDGKQMITDGPFAETKEQLAGFFLLECNDLEEAIAIAAMIPGAKYGSIEVRPLINTR
jgi:hypothetical protein